MSGVTMCFIANATFLLLHEIESGHEREWEVLRLPGGITVFLLLHVPIIPLLFWGVIELAKGSTVGACLGVAMGTLGIMPVLVHEVLLRRPDRFHRALSKVIIYANAAAGMLLLGQSIRLLA